MVDSRCGLHCTGCEYKETCGCNGCIETNGHPFHGECPVAVCCQDKGFLHCGECPDIPCELLTQYSCDPEHGDTPHGARIAQCIRWAKENSTENIMSRFTEKGYFVKENAPIYFTEDMTKTIKWFEEVMGWYSKVVEKDDSGNGLYGVVFDILPEIEATHLAHFTGYQLFRGKPEQRVISFMQVQDIDKMHSYITSKGWDKITQVETQPWGGKTCSITTIDGYVINVFQ